MFMDNTEIPLLVYSTPVLRFGKKTTSPHVSWDAQTLELSVSLAGAVQPLSVVFGVHTKLPDANKYAELSAQFAAENVHEPAEDDEEDGTNEGEEDEESATKSAIKVCFFVIAIANHTQFGFKFPSLHFGASWTNLLYGDKRGTKAAPLSQSECTLCPPSVNFGVTLSLSGNMLVHTDMWSFSVSPPSGFSLPNSQLFSGERFVVLRAAAGEIGFSFAQDQLKYFIVLSSALAVPKILLQLKVSLK